MHVSEVNKFLTLKPEQFQQLQSVGMAPYCTDMLSFNLRFIQGLIVWKSAHLLHGSETAVLFSASSLSFPPTFFAFFAVNTITHERLQLDRWKFAKTCILTTAKSLLNIKVTQRAKVEITWNFCVYDTAATRGQYLALGKSWQSC